MNELFGMVAGALERWVMHGLEVHLRGMGCAFGVVTGNH